MTKTLIVSPERSVFTPIESLFNNKKFFTRWTDTGRKALELIIREGFDLIILHEHLPDMNGKTLAEKIITCNAMINCVISSSLPEKDFHEIYEGLGILMQFPLTPTAEHGLKLIEYLGRMDMIFARPHRVTGEAFQ